ncbi:MAG: Pvc16 family protein [Planctomycetota bacterium]
MSSIFSISDSLKTLLSRGHSYTMQLKDPTEADQSNAVSVWLYQIQADEFSRNNAPPVLNKAASNGNEVGVAKQRRSAVPPLGVNLFYLVTPMTGNVESDHEVLGRMLLTIHESPTLRVQQSELGEDELIRISLPADPLEERLHLWDSLKTKPYRLSFICLLRTARLFTSNVIEEAPVLNLSSAPLLEFPKI